MWDLDESCAPHYRPCAKGIAVLCLLQPVEAVTRLLLLRA